MGFFLFAVFSAGQAEKAADRDAQNCFLRLCSYRYSFAFTSARVDVAGDKLAQYDACGPNPVAFVHSKPIVT